MGNVFHSFCTTIIAMCLFIYLGGVLIEQEKELISIKEETKNYQALLAEANMKTEELRETKSRINTDEYIEEYAREKLGLVMPYEIIFVDASI